MFKEFTKRKVPFKAQAPLPLRNKGERLPQTYRSDFVCYGKIIVEIKAVKETCDEHRAQVLNYLKATGFQLGLLVNFGHTPRATIERLAS